MADEPAGARTGRQLLGDAAESLVAERLDARGWRILAGTSTPAAASWTSSPSIRVRRRGWSSWRCASAARATSACPRRRSTIASARSCVSASPACSRPARCQTVRSCRACRSRWTWRSWSRGRGQRRPSGSTGTRSSVRYPRRRGRDRGRPCATLRAGRRVATAPGSPAERWVGAEITRRAAVSGRCRTGRSRRLPVPDRSAAEETTAGGSFMPSVSMRQLLEAGVHFGHQTRRWNPKMSPFIFAERNGIHIIDLAQTVKRLDLALEAARETVARGDTVLFIGTKKQAQEPIAQEATRAGQPYVNRRWLGGMLTNFVTIKKRIALLDQLEARQASGDFERLTKKEVAKLVEEMDHLRDSFGGIRKMKRLPGMVFIVDPHRERIAVTESRKLEIPIIGTGDTNVDPDELDYIIPGQRRRHPRHPPALPARGRRLHRRPARARCPRRRRGRGARSPGRSRRSRKSPPRSWSRPWRAAPPSPSSPTSTRRRSSCPVRASFRPSARCRARRGAPSPLSRYQLARFARPRARPIGRTHDRRTEEPWQRSLRRPSRPSASRAARASWSASERSRRPAATSRRPPPCSASAARRRPPSAPTARPTRA